MQDRKQENQDSHASDPVGKATPEKNTSGKYFNIFYNAGSCSGKAGYCLEKGIDGIGDRAADEKGKRSHNT